MTVWIIVAVIVIWMLVSAIILVSLCMMSSRFNRSEKESEIFDWMDEVSEEERPRQGEQNPPLPHAPAS